jgi:hypothetical protein
MLHEIAVGEKFKMPDADDEIYGRSFWSGLSHKVCVCVCVCV